MFGGFGNLGGGIGANDVVAYVGVQGTQQFIGEFRKMDRTVLRFSSSFRESMATLTKAYGAVIAGAAALGTAMASVAKQAADFQKGMANVSTLLDVSDKQMKALSRGVLQLSKRLPQSADKLTTALYDLVSAGVDAKNALKALELSSKAAVAGVTDAQTAVRAGMSVINAYGLSLDELNRVYDIQFKTVKKGVVTYEQLANSIGSVLPAATALGVSLEDLFSGIAVLTKAGQSADMATTNLGRLFQGFVEQQDKFKQLGIEIFDATGKFRGLIPVIEDLNRVLSGLTDEQRQAVLEMLNLDIRAGRALVPLTQLLDTAGGLRDTFNEIAHSGGAMNEAFSKIDATASTQFAKLKNSIEALAITLGEKLLPAITENITKINEFVDTINFAVQSKAFDNIIKYVKEFTRDMQALQKVITPVWFALNMMTKSIQALNRMRKESEFKSALQEIGQNLTPTFTHVPNVQPIISISEGDLKRLRNYLQQVNTMRTILSSIKPVTGIQLRVTPPPKLEDTVRQVQDTIDSINFDHMDSAIADLVDSLNTMGLTAQNVAMSIQAAMYRLSSRIVDAMFDARTSFQDIWKDIAKDFLRLFVQEVLKQIAILAVKVVLQMALFDKYENDRMAERVGQDYARYFSKGVLDGLTKNMTPEVVNKLVAPEVGSIPVRMADGGTALKVEVETIPIEENRVRAYFQRVNREVLIPDQRYVDQFLTTEKTEFD